MKSLYSEVSDIEITSKSHIKNQGKPSIFKNTKSYKDYIDKAKVISELLNITVSQYKLIYEFHKLPKNLINTEDNTCIICTKFEDINSVYLYKGFRVLLIKNYISISDGLTALHDINSRYKYLQPLIIKTQTIESGRMIEHKHYLGVDGCNIKIDIDNLSQNIKDVLFN